MLKIPTVSETAAHAKTDDQKTARVFILPPLTVSIKVTVPGSLRTCDASWGVISERLPAKNPI